MRRPEKEIRDPERLREILDAAPVGRLGTVGVDGAPRIKPLNFVRDGGAVYFHTARQGEKIRDLERDPRVCFEVDVPIAYVAAAAQPCEADYLFRSVIVRGRARLVEDDAEKRRALELLMSKYQPEGGWGDWSPEKLRLVGVVRIDAEEMTGKEHLRDGALRDAALAVLAGGGPLPVRLPRG